MSDQQVKKKKKKRKISKLILTLIFILGLSIAAYPIISRLYYTLNAAEQVTKFDIAAKDLTSEEVKKRLNLAHAYNESIQTSNVTDPYTDAEKAAGKAEYARMLEIHEQMGHVEIPKIGIDIPIFAGTAEVVLQKGAGHLEGTSLPVGGNSTHSVITAHSGLPTARLFSELSKLKIGDKFYIYNLEGVIAYQVDQIKIIDPTDFSDLLVSKGLDYVTLLTCTPIMINTHRLLVRGHRIEYVAAIEEPLIAENKTSFMFRYLFYGMSALAFLLLLILLRQRSKRKKAEKELKKIKAIKREEVNKVEEVIDSDNESINNSTTESIGIQPLDEDKKEGDT